MIAVIVSCFNNYDIRVKYVEEVLLEMGYKSIYICSDYDHTTKSRYNIEKENAIQIEVKSYKKNMSIARIRSHLGFSRKVYEKIDEIKPNLIYAIIPPNSIVRRLSKYKKANGNVKIVYDFFDMWPESLPIENAIKKLLLPWKNVRNKNLFNSDVNFIECDLYREYLPKGLNYHTAYLCKPQRNIKFEHDDKTLNFLYLGSINNLIDIKSIMDFLNNVKNGRKICLYIVGKGAKEDLFAKGLKENDIDFINCGPIYNDEEKDKIIAKCHFGINIYKKDLVIGLTMKSLDYFSCGLPIINKNIHDTKLIINKYDCGFDITNIAINYQKLWELDESEWNLLHKNTQKAYDDYFTVTKFKNLLKGKMFDNENQCSSINI